MKRPHEASRRQSPDAGTTAGDSWTGTVEQLFDRFPYGLFTVDDSRRVLSINRACRELIPRLSEGPQPEPMTCCDLVCSHLDGDEARCLSVEALASAEVLPDIRVRLDRRRGTFAWVTVSSIASAHRAVFHLRPAKPEERWRDGESQVGVESRLRVFALGPTRVERAAGGLITGAWLQQRPGQLFKYLVCARGRLIEAEDIARALWPESGSKGASTVRYFVHVLRQRLEPSREGHGTSSFIDSRGGGYALDTDRVWLDVTDFENLVSGGLAALVGGRRQEALRLLERGVNLYRGDLVADERYAEWALADRDRLRELAGRALRALTELRLADDDPFAAGRHARRLADLEPYDSDAQRLHIECSLRLGRRTEAVRRYNQFRRRLLRAFGEKPDFELADLTAAADADSE